MAQMICTACGTIGYPKKVTKGSFAIELVLWLAFILPGLIYSLWRLTTRYKACPQCRSPYIVPLNSPRGRKLAAEAKAPAAAAIDESAAEPVKSCPQCAETVKAAAKICRYCRYEFPEPQQVATGSDAQGG